MSPESRDGAVDRCPALVLECRVFSVGSFMGYDIGCVGVRLSPCSLRKRASLMSLPARRGAVETIPEAGRKDHACRRVRISRGVAHRVAVESAMAVRT